jgi:hypothetical protein
VSIAARYGVAWQDVWNHPRNATLRRTRDPSVLRAGDVVTIPDQGPAQRVSRGGTHRFRFQPPLATIRLSLAEETAPTSDDQGSTGGAVPAGTAYRLEAGGHEATGTTDGEGGLEAEVPVHATDARLILEPGTERERVVYLAIGHLDPLDVVGGAKQRLRNLGYGITETTDEPNPTFTAVLRSFQRDQGLEETGELDDATRNALRGAHGS